MPKTFAITTLGCKVNQYESQQIRALLTSLGLKPAGPRSKPDLSIINTCCVTKIASSKSRQYIQKARKLNGGSNVIVVGCLTAAPQQELGAIADNVHLIKNRPAIAAELSTIITKNTAPKLPQLPPENHKQTTDTNIKPQSPQKSKSKNRPNLPILPDLTAFTGHTRAFLKAQDGCDSYCTYCIIPIVRPRIESRSADSICREAENLIKSGHREIVLTGICLGAFGRTTTRRRNWPDPHTDRLAELLDRLASVPNLPRLRVSSLNPQDITPQLLDVFAAHTNIMPHLHLSLQSGSNIILRKMARQYTTEDYLEKVRLLKDRLDNPAITTDIIVGFPGETGSDFEDTLDLARQVGFARIHVFSFSARKGTPAYKMTPGTKPQLIKERARILQTLADELAFDYRQTLLGRQERVLIESTENRIASGRAERYFEVKIKNAQNILKKNDIKEVTLTANTPTHLVGTL